METYEEFINNILNTRGRFNCGEEYHERHHITPRCCGGTNDPDNLIDLYVREHFIAHRLLCFEHPENRDLAAAALLMALRKNEHQEKRYICDPEEYEAIRKEFSRATKELYADKTKHPCYGKLVTEETRKKQSERAKARLADPTHNPMYGKRQENNPNYGKKRDPDINYANS